MPEKKTLYSTFQLLSLLSKGIRKKAVIAFFLIIFQGITEGVGLLFIIPLLAISGIKDAGSSNNFLVQSIRNIFESNGLSLSVLNVLILYVIIMSFYAILRYFQSINTATINQGVVIYWRNHFFKRLTYASWSSIQGIKSSDIQDTLTIEIRKFGSISNQVIQIIGTIVLIIVYLIISAFLSFKLTLLALIPVMLMVLLNRPINKKTYLLGQSSVGFNKQMQEIILEHLLALKLVKSYNQEKRHISDFEKVNEAVESKVVSFTKAQQKTKALFEIIAAVVIAGYIYTAIVIFETPITELLLLIFIFARLLPKTTKFISNYQQILNLLPSLEWTINVLGQLKKEQETNANSIRLGLLSKSIQFNSVHFGYHSKKVLKNVSLSIPANQTTLIIGASGKGKSTLIDLIMGLQQPEQGEILIDNIPFHEISSKKWKSAIAYIPQDSFLFNESIEYNLKWVNEEADETLIQASLEQAGAKDFIERLPLGLKTIVGDRGTQLSGGERQRIALARALIRQPQLLILDEATNAVDDKNELLIKNALAKLHGKMTIIIVAHRSKLIDLADHTIKL